MLRKRFLMLVGVYVSVCASSDVATDTFSDVWSDMQEVYHQWCEEFHTDAYRDITKKYVHPKWQHFCKQIGTFLSGEPREDFLSFDTISYTMVRTGRKKGSIYEENFLQYCLSDETKKLIACCKEPDYGKPNKECELFDCSANMLGQLYYAARIYELVDSPERVRTIVDLCGQYGCLAYILSTMFSGLASYYLIDVPEVLALQYLFLRLALPEIDIHVHSSQDYTETKKHGIHLIPIQLVPDLDFDADIFISNFGLTEAKPDFQKIIFEKHFMHAKLAFIAGQLDGWGNFDYEGHNEVHRAIRNHYAKIDCRPFHYLPKMKSFELVATSPTVAHPYE